MDVPPSAVPVDNLAEKNGATIPQLGHKMAKLMPGVGHRDRLGIHRQPVAGKQKVRLRGKKSGLQAQFCSQFMVENDQPRIGNRDRGEAGMEMLGKTLVAVVKMKGWRRHRQIPWSGRVPVADCLLATGFKNMMPFGQKDKTKTLGDESPRPPLFFNNSNK
jgi:hypothetical protein